MATEISNYGTYRGKVDAQLVERFVDGGQLEHGRCVRQVGADAYQIIAGERRFRATEINSSATIRAIVVNSHRRSA